MTYTGPSGYTIFSDDIRLEEGGKVTLVGVYSHYMYIQGGFPFTAPKFGLRVIYTEPLETMGKEKVAFRVSATWSEEPLAQGEFPMSGEFAGDMPDVAPADLAIFGMHVMFTPLVIPGPGLIKVRAFRGEQKIKLGSLRIGKVPSPPSSV